MKPYGIDKKDLAKDCTASSKYGTRKLADTCSCGKKHAKRSKKISAASRVRNINIEKLIEQI